MRGWTGRWKWNRCLEGYAGAESYLCDQNLEVPVFIHITVPWSQQYHSTNISFSPLRQLLNRFSILSFVRAFSTFHIWGRVPWWMISTVGESHVLFKNCSKEKVKIRHATSHFLYSNHVYEIGGRLDLWSGIIQDVSQCYSRVLLDRFEHLKQGIKEWRWAWLTIEMRHRFPGNFERV